MEDKLKEISKIAEQAKIEIEKRLPLLTEIQKVELNTKLAEKGFGNLNNILNKLKCR